MMEFDLEAFVEAALREDVGDGDHTTRACVSPDRKGEAVLKIKSDGVLAGVDIARRIFAKHDASLKFEAILHDGDSVRVGQEAFHIRGPIGSILTTERLVLNIMQRMSGIATVTREYAKAIAHTKAKVLDTRKTTPLFRWFEKEAVLIGGGANHRFGLYDMILIKDNHVDAAGSVSNALEGAVSYLRKNKLKMPIEIEVRSMEELREAIFHGGMQRVMLDNFMISSTMEAVRLVNGACEIESSGGITIKTIRDYAECGVDFISVGALTHSVQSLDLSLKISG